MESSKQRWAIRLHKQDAWQLLELREFEGVVAAFCEDSVWAQGDFDSNVEEVFASSASTSSEPTSSQQLDLKLRGIAGAERFRLLEDDQLIPYGNRVPKGRLPLAQWQPLTELIELELPVAGFAGQQPAPAKIRLVRGANKFVGASIEPELLMCDFEEWSRYACSAPQVRLNSLSFACSASDDNQTLVVVRGRPLPSIPGELFVLLHNIAVPVGWSWEPSVSPETLRECFNVSEDSLVILFSDGRWNLVSSSQFVAAKRSSVRATEARVVGDVY